MDLGLKDKVVVITGGTAGIGLKTAELFLQEGAKVAICGRNEDRLEKTKQQLEAVAPGYVYARVCDVLNEADVKAFIDGTAEHFGRIDVLVNNAGKSVMGRFFDITDEQWQEQIQLKYFAIIYAIRAVHPYMKQNGGGRIINMNATLAKEPEKHMVATAAARAGLHNLSKTLAHELAPDNILVNSIGLGLIRTDQWERRRMQQAPDRDPQEWYTELAVKRNIPLGRVGEPEEVASVIVFLSSARASYVSGTFVEVAGGLGKAL